MSIKFGESLPRTYWWILNLATALWVITSYASNILLAGFYNGDFPRIRQITKLKTSPKFPAIRYLINMITRRFNASVVLSYTSDCVGGLTAVCTSFILWLRSLVRMSGMSICRSPPACPSAVSSTMKAPDRPAPALCVYGMCARESIHRATGVYCKIVYTHNTFLYMYHASVRTCVLTT